MSELKDKAILEVRTYCHMLGLASNLDNTIDALINSGLIKEKEDENKIKADAVLSYLSSVEIPENAKSKMIGEFEISHTETCSGCYYDEPDEECEVCGGEVDYQVSIDVPWTIQKDIFKKFVECAKSDYANKLERGE